ncbi:5'-nucleotidase C-terminal domain-containing protein [candidate division KSB1 bacterium]|nr:5'-nucleotidase C-terminal domain-containing protein [candidate division KSB1 bacterium]
MVLPPGAAESFHLLFTGDIQGTIFSDRDDSHGDLLAIEKTLAAMRDSLAGEPILVLDTGDVLAYHYLARVDSGATVFALINRAGFDAIVPGNLDFSYGYEQIRDLDRSFDSPRLLAANLMQADTCWLSPYHVIENGGVRFGVLGLVDPNYLKTVANKNLGDLSIQSAAEAVQTHLPLLRSQCDVVIALTHLATDDCLQLVRSVSGIDIVIAKPGSEEDRFYKVYKPDSDLYTFVITAPADARALGYLYGRVENDGVMTDEAYRTVAVGAAADSTLSTFCRELDDKYIQRFERQYGFSPDEALISQTHAPEPDTVVRSLLTLLLDRFGAEIAILNRGFFRFNTAELREVLTPRDIDKIFWSNDHAAVVEMSGKELEALEARSRSHSPEARERLYALAMQNSDRDFSDPWQIHGREIEDNARYRVVTSKFLAQGGDGYTLFADRPSCLRFIQGRRLSPNERGEEQPINSLYLRGLSSARQQNEIVDLSQWVKEHPAVNRPLWRLQADRLDLGARKISIADNTALVNAKESRIKASTRGSDAFTAHTVLRLIRESRGLRWENSALFRYDRTRIAADDGQSPLSTLETNVEFETVADLLSPSRAHNPFIGLRYDTDHRFRQKDLYGTLGYSTIGQANNTLRLGVLAKADLLQEIVNIGIELTARFRLPLGGLDLDSRLRSRYLTGNGDALPEDERFSFDLTQGVQVPLTKNTRLFPRLDLFVYRPRGFKSFARNIQFSVNLSYTRDWKFQYQGW